MLSLLTLTALSVSLAFLILASYIIQKNSKELIKYVFAGAIVSIIDFVVEFIGTSVNNWNYYESIYFIFGKIPIELIMLFFSAGVIARFIWIFGNKLKSKIESPAFNYNNLLYLFMLIGAVFYVRSMLLMETVYLIIFAIPFALWGILNIRKENIEISLIMAFVVFIADFLIEILILSRGDYAYADGFNVNIPLVYSLMLLGVFGILERFHKLDKFIDSKFVHLLIKKSVFDRRKQIKKLTQKLKSHSRELINFIKF